MLNSIIKGLNVAEIIHRDLHSGNILEYGYNFYNTVMCDLESSKSSTESADDEKDLFGIEFMMQN